MVTGNSSFSDTSENANSLENYGMVAVYQFDNDNWQKVAALKPHYPAAMTKFGSSVAITPNGKTVVVGAPGDNNSNHGIDPEFNTDDPTIVDSGAIYVY